MRKPATYRSKLSSRGQSPWRSHSAPSPIVPASKLYTTPTMLSSGNTPKKMNFVGVLSNSSPVLASPFAPGGLARWPARPGLRPEGSLSFPCRPVFVRRLANYARQAATATATATATAPAPAHCRLPTANCYRPPCPSTTPSLGDRGAIQVLSWSPRAIPRASPGFSLAIIWRYCVA